jgi:hypothetical protein
MMNKDIIRLATNHCDSIHTSQNSQKKQYLFTPEGIEAMLKEYTEKARIDALEQAAVICDALHHNWRFGDDEDSESGPRQCAETIRTLIPEELREPNDED